MTAHRGTALIATPFDFDCTAAEVIDGVDGRSGDASTGGSLERGYEMQFATNHLGHFALAIGLRDALAAAGHARVVSVSSSGHLRSPVVFDDLALSLSLV